MGPYSVDLFPIVGLIVGFGPTKVIRSFGTSFGNESFSSRVRSVDLHAASFFELKTMMLLRNKLLYLFQQN